MEERLLSPHFKYGNYERKGNTSTQIKATHTLTGCSLTTAVPHHGYFIRGSQFLL